MFKRIITASVLGISALGMMAANAATPGIYVTGAVGLAHTGNKFKSLPDVTVSKDKKSIRDNLTGRLAIGYQFSPNWAAELGYTQFSKQKSNLTTIASTHSLITLSQHAFDIDGKAIYPLTDKFNVYAKAGMAYLTNNVKGKGTDTYKSKPVSAMFSKHNWAPEAGLGFTYDITSNVFIDTAYTHIQPIGKNKLSNIDFATVGIGYSFG